MAGGGAHTGARGGGKRRQPRGGAGARDSDDTSCARPTFRGHKRLTMSLTVSGQMELSNCYTHTFLPASFWSWLSVRGGYTKESLCTRASISQCVVTTSLAASLFRAMGCYIFFHTYHLCDEFSLFLIKVLCAISRLGIAANGTHSFLVPGLCRPDWAPMARP